MNELIDIKPDINVREIEYNRLLGYPHNFKIEGRARELADWARDWYLKNGHPWIYAVPVQNINYNGKNLTVNDVDFSSQKLREQFHEADVQSAMIVVVSAGRECEEKAEQLWHEEKPDEYFFLEIFGSAVVEHLVTNTGFRFCSWAEENNLAVLPHYSPGYTGWNIEDQKKLWELLKIKKSYNFPGEINVFDSGMIKPKKSMLALFGFAGNINAVKNIAELVPCESCSLYSCQYRRAPYKHYRNQIENVANMQGKSSLKTGMKNPGENIIRKTTLTPDAKYSVSNKALKKWLNERLKLKILDDSSIEAIFRYEGSTCSNMGHKLEFDFTVKLSSADEGYKILNLACLPAPNDDGYTYMCEYINDPEFIMSEIEKEKPLLGKSLNDIINWKREFSPEGCFCNSESRKHKWGLVFEVLHYGLVQYESEQNKISLISK